MANRTPLFFDTTTGAYKGISSTIDNAFVAGVASGTATDLTLLRAGNANQTVVLGAAGTTYGSDMIAFGVATTGTFNLVNTSATTLNVGGAATTVSLGAATGTATINNANTVIAGSLAANGAAITTDDATFALLNTAATTINFGGAATIGINMGATNGLTTITGSARITQNLTVVGTTTTTESETVLINDNHLYLNNAYTTAVAQTGGLVVNYLPTATASTVAAGGFVAGVAAVSNPTVAIAASAVFTVGDFIQVSGATNPANNGLFEVLSNATATMTVRGIGLTAAVEDFTQNQFVTNAGAVGAVTKITVSIMRSGTDGLWEVGQASVTPVTFSDLATGSSSGWTDDGAVVRLTTATDNVGIGTATPGTNKLNITNDTTGDRNLILVEVAAQTAAPFRIETSAAALEFEVAVGGNTTTAGDLAVNGGDITTSAATATLFNATATTLSVGGAATALSLGAATGTLTIGNPTITGTNATALNLNGASPSIATTSTTANVFNATVTTLNIGGAATTVSLGAATGTTTINNANTVVAGSLAANGAAITTDDTTFALLNTTATTINFGGAATTINAGAAASTFATGFSAVTSSQATVALFNTTTTALNIGAAATTTFGGAVVMNGNVTLGDANTDNITVGGEFVSSLIPDVTLTSDLGSSTKLWNNLFVGNLVSNVAGATYVVGASTVNAASVVYKTATANQVQQADATSITTGSNKIIGVARTTATTGNDVVVDYSGIVTMDAATGITITAGDLVYLAVGTTGEVTNVSPSASTQVSVVVGIAKTTSASGGTFLAQLHPRTPVEIP